MLQTIEQFGATIKAKYPQYRDISDAELGQKMLTKYPQYQDMVQTVQPEKKSLLQKVGDFLGVGGLARGITSSILTSTDKEYNRILEKINKGQSPTAGERAYFESIAGGIPTSKEVVGSAIQTAATIGTIGIGGAGKGALGIAKMAGKVGIAGGVAGFGAGLEAEKSTEDSLKQAFTTGLTSAITAGTLTTIGRLGKVALQKLPARIYASAAKLDSQTANVLMNERQIGTLGRLNGIAQAETRALNSSIAEKIKLNNGIINNKNFLETVVSKIKDQWKGASNKQINTAIKSFKLEPFLKKGTTDFIVADNIRKGVGTDLQNVWKSADPKFNGDVGKIIWKELVNTIRPSTGTGQAFSRLEAYTNLAIKTGTILKNQQSKFGLKLTDLVLGGGVGLGGGGVAGVGAVVAKKTLESSLAKTTTAVGMNELNKVIQKIPTDTAGRISRTALVNALKNIGQ